MRPSFLSIPLFMPLTANPKNNFISPLLLSAAFLSAVFYHNVNIDYLVITKALLVLLAVTIFWASATQSIKLPSNTLAIAAALFWCYLVLNIPLGNIPEHNSYTVWLISMLPATFFLYQLADIKAQQWNLLLVSIIIIVTGLSLHYIYQINSNNLPFNGAGASFFPNRNILAALLNLVIFTTSALFINPGQQRRPVFQITLGTALFIMAYTMAMTQSRGGLIAFFSALALFIFLSYHKIPKRKLISLITILFAALLLTNTNLGIGSDLFNNLSTLKEPSSAGSSRFLIWEGAWHMIQDAPWLGHGAGTFSLLYPQYRLPADNSGGLFVHNDYLQIWVEMGLPALILLIILLFMAAHTFIKFWRSANSTAAQLEAGGLFCGLTSIAIHSLFTFNLYILSMLILCGLFLGRLNQLCTTGSLAFINLVPKDYIKPSLFRMLILIICSIFLVSLASSWAHQYYYQRAISEHKAKKFDLANKSFALSSELLTTYASLTSHASLLADSIKTWPKSDVEKRKALYTSALQFLDEAKALNPLRPSQYNVRAHLYSTYPEFAGKNHLTLAQKAYQDSLDLNPRLFKVRYLLAKLLLSENKTNEALRVLEPGLIEPFFPWENPTPYLHQTMSLHLINGDEDSARKLARTIQKRQKKDKRLDIDAILNTGHL